MRFEEAKAALAGAYEKENRNFDPSTGWEWSALRDWAERETVRRREAGEPMITVRAELLAFLLDHARTGIHPAKRFEDSFDCEGILDPLRWKVQAQIDDPDLRKREADTAPARKAMLFTSNPDYGHLCPDWDAMLALGIPGIAARVRRTEAEKAAAPGGITEEQKTFYRACAMTWDAVQRAVSRLGKAAEKEGKTDIAARLAALSCRAPETFAEALQLILVLFRIFEYVDGMRTRSLGGLDRLLYPFWKKETEAGTEPEELREDLRFFLYECWSMHVPFDLPFRLGGRYADGRDATNPLSLEIVKVYASLDIYSPKIHVLVNGDTDREFLRAVCDSIRHGNSSFVFINDDMAFRALTASGVRAEDAYDYVPIGCYEATSYGKEIGCTGCGAVNLTKCVEMVLFDGVDPMTGKTIGVKTGDPMDFSSFEVFYDAFMKQFRAAADAHMALIRAYERHYAQVYPVPLFSATFSSCLENGKDALDGGAQYNNSSINLKCIGSAVDSLIVIKHIMEHSAGYDLDGLKAMLLADWKGYEAERKQLDMLPRYGNHEAEADALADRISLAVGQYCIGKPNARGGVFKPGLYSIDYNVKMGAHMIATPDGRTAGVPLSKNLGSVTGKDRNGITALILSAARTHSELYANGSVLDVMMHPTAVSGEDGTQIMLSLVEAYFSLGGFAMHGNVVSADILEAAQRDPVTYANLQVRLCGWNVYFVNLSRVEQDELILAASGR